MFLSVIMTAVNFIYGVILSASDFIGQLWSGLGQVVSDVIDFFANLFESIVKIFYTAPTGSETTGSLTMLGWLLLISLGVGMFWLAFRLIRGLVGRMGRR